MPLLDPSPQANCAYRELFAHFAHFDPQPIPDHLSLTTHNVSHTPETGVSGYWFPLCLLLHCPCKLQHRICSSVACTPPSLLQPCLWPAASHCRKYMLCGATAAAVWGSPLLRSAVPAPSLPSHQPWPPAAARPPPPSAARAAPMWAPVHGSTRTTARRLSRSRSRSSSTYRRSCADKQAPSCADIVAPCRAGFAVPSRAALVAPIVWQWALDGACQRPCP